MALDAGAISAILVDSLPEGVWERVGGVLVAEKLAGYLRLLLRWNAVVNLTAVRDPAEVVRRHFAESLFLGSLLPAVDDLLDLGSGAGFPGVPVQLVRPEVRVTLAEGRSKKVAFLREVVRELGVEAQVLSGRAEAIEAGRFDAVCLRAVDPMQAALGEASRLARSWVMIVGSGAMRERYGEWLDGWRLVGKDEIGDAGTTVFRFGR